MRVHIPSPLYSYTAGRGEVEGEGATLAELLADLDRRFPGLRFRIIDEQDRIRPHIKLFVDGEPARDLSPALGGRRLVHILCALSGGAAPAA